MADVENPPSPPPEEIQGEVLMIPFLGKGHLFPFTELCNHLASRNVKTTIVVPSYLIPYVSSACDHPLIGIFGLEVQPPPSDSPMHMYARARMVGEPLDKFLAERTNSFDRGSPVCAVVDFLMGWTTALCKKHKVPTIGFSTSGASSAAIELAGSKTLDNRDVHQIVRIPGMPESLQLTYSDFQRGPRRPGYQDRPPAPNFSGAGNFQPPSTGMPPNLPGAGHFPPPGTGMRPNIPGASDFRPPGSRGSGRWPPWLDEMEGSIAYIFNTCADLERPFLDFVAKEMGLPVFGVGPLLPRKFWDMSGSLLLDGSVRVGGKHPGITEAATEAWLDAKPKGSVVYVSFGSEVGPGKDELAQLAAGLEEARKPFIWVIQPDVVGDPVEFLPDGFKARVEGWGLVVCGWAPQLLILSHPSTGGFLSHCGWNSTMESLGRGVPMLAWPIRGDQFNITKLVANYLGAGVVFSCGNKGAVTKEVIVSGVEKLMGDKGIKERAVEVSRVFQSGFPTSSSESLDGLKDFVHGL